MPFNRKKSVVSPYINRFLQPDSVIPNPANPQSLNRFGYVLNNPIRFNDPTGHVCEDPEKEGALCFGSGTTRVGDKMVHGNHAELVAANNENQEETLLRPSPYQVVRGGIYVGSNYPKTLAQREEEIFGGGPVELLDSTASGEDSIAAESNTSYSPNVNASVVYTLNQDGLVGVVYLDVENNSEFRVFVMNVTFAAQAGPFSGLLTDQSLPLDQTYQVNPPRIRPQLNSDKFLIIDPGDFVRTSLTPSGNPGNPNNQFGPSMLQTVTVYVLFAFQPDPGQEVITFNLLP
jgi:hypothetical protein